jgi:hypothetical protein
MATSVPSLGKGLALKRGNGASPEAFTTLTMVRNISAFGEEKPLVEITHFQSNAREYINGLADGKEYQVTALFLPEDATQNFTAGVLKDYADDVTKNYRMYTPAGSGGGYFYFAAICRSWEFTANPANALEIQFTMKITGGVHFQAGA